jgi:hypothetical protein
VANGKAQVFQQRRRDRDFTIEQDSPISFPSCQLLMLIFFRRKALSDEANKEAFERSSRES